MILDNNCPKGWLYKTVEDVSTKVTSGGTPSRKKSDYYSITGYCWVKTKELENKYIYDTEEKISEIGLRKSSAKLLPKNTLLVAMYGATVGKLGMTSKEMTCNQACCAIVTNPIECIPLFLFYKFLNSSKKLEMLSIGAAQQNLSGQFIKEIQFSFPNISNQERIVAVLSNLDSKIELNQQMNKTLEDIAKTLFKSWFIDFDPVRAKAEGRPTGLSKEISDLFPDSLEDSEFGLIPKGWNYRSIYEDLNVIYGAPFSSKMFNSDSKGIQVIRIRDLKKQKSNIYTEEVHPKGVLIEKGDVVVGMDGEFRPYLWSGENAWMNQRICKFEPKHHLSSTFIIETLRKQLRFIELTEVATTVIHLGKSDIDEFLMLNEERGVIKKFNQICIPIEEKIISNNSESRKLEEIRDILLPKLISGELKIPDAENLIEEADI